MTEDQKYEIAILAEDAHEKWQMLECHQALNVCGKTADELSKMAIQYEIAKTEWMQAKAKLANAQNRIAAS
jgi:uncharacterized coiled-coil DUF342 family protein